MRLLNALTLIAALAAAVRADPPLPAGYWPQDRSADILSRTVVIRLAPDTSRLDAGERAAVAELLQAGQVMQELYEHSRHPQALEAHTRLRELHAARGGSRPTENLMALYRLFQGPIASTLDNRREPFLPVDPQVPGRNVYPVDVTRPEIDAFLAAHPDRRGALLADRTIVRRATRENLETDLRVLATSPFSTLHWQVALDLQQLAKEPDATCLYAVPYAVAYAGHLLRAYRHLAAAAEHIEASDAEFARYLRNRARDLLSNDYESGDASWVTGRFARLNAQVGAYETYDDALFGVKAFHALSLLLLNEPATADLRSRLGGLQAIENALPIDRHKRVRDDISIGVYSVIADFGQARGTNTATILPNDALFSRRYGRTILLRENILRDPEIVAADLRTWQAATAEAHAADLDSEGNVQRTLWHEVGHYLGVDTDRHGRPLDVAFAEHADALEEMKSDLVSLFALHRMHADGTITSATLRTVQASGIRRTLQDVKPRPDQPYQTMQLAQFNCFLDAGLVVFDPGSVRLSIRYDKYADVVTALLGDVLRLQHEGDKTAAASFFERWGAWTPDVHARLADRISDAQGPRFRLVRYAALGE